MTMSEPKELVIRKKEISEGSKGPKKYPLKDTELSDRLGKSIFIEKEGILDG